MKTRVNAQKPGFWGDFKWGGRGERTAMYSKSLFTTLVKVPIKEREERAAGAAKKSNQAKGVSMLGEKMSSVELGRGGLGPVRTRACSTRRESEAGAKGKIKLPKKKRPP